MRYRIRGVISEENKEHEAAFDAMSKDPDGTVLIEISTPGGDVGQLLQYMSKIIEAKAAGKKIVTYASGAVMSAGATLLWQGDEIYVSPVSVIMFHLCVNSCIHGPLDTLWLAMHAKWHEWKTGKSEVFGTFSDKVLMRWEPWDKLLHAFGENKPNGEYFVSASELALTFPGKVRIGIPPYKDLDLFGSSDEEMVSLSEVLEEVKSIRDEQALEDAIKEEEEGEDDDEGEEEG